jgi:hypothetical protein
MEESMAVNQRALTKRVVIDPDELLTLFECEAMSKRKVSTWRKDIRLRKVPYVRIGRQIRVQRSVVEQMINDGFMPAVKVV